MTSVGSVGERHLETRLKQLGFGGWLREHPFDEGRKWRFDFAHPELRIAIEVEGGIWSKGSHVRGKRFEADAAKYNAAAIAGWMVLRFTTEQVTDDSCLDTIRKAITAVVAARNGQVGRVLGG